MFQLWMNSIHCYCRLEDQKNKFESNTADNKKDKHNYLEPPVIIVGSHKDKVEPSEEKKVEVACRENLLMYTNSLPDDERGHIRHCYMISNTDDNQTVFQVIRQNILKIARTMKTWNTSYPLKFIQLEQQLQKRKTESPIISYDEIRNLSFDTPKPLDDEELRLFLEFHHATRSLVYFKDLSEYIILDTQWLSDAFKCIVTAKTFRDKSVINQQKWNDLQHKGKLHHEVLEEIFDKEESILIRHKDHILEVMKKYDIIILPNKSQIDSTEDPPYYYVPCLIEDGPGCNIHKVFELTDVCRSTWLCFEFRFLPPHLMNHLIASWSRRYDVAEVVDNEQNTRQIALYRGTAVFELQPTQQSRKLLIMKCPNFIQIQVWEFGEHIIRGLYKGIGDLVTDDIEKIIQTRFNMSNVKFEKKWKCGVTKPDSVTKLREFKKKSEEQISKYYCETCKQVHKFIDEWSVRPSEQKGNLRSPDISYILDQMMTNLVISVNDRRTIEQNVGQEAQEQKLIKIVNTRGEPNKSLCIGVLQQYSGYRELAIELKNANSLLPTENTEIQDVPDYKVRLQKNYLKIINTIQHNSQ